MFYNGFELIDNEAVNKALKQMLDQMTELAEETETLAKKLAEMIGFDAGPAEQPAKIGRKTQYKPGVYMYETPTVIGGTSTRHKCIWDRLAQENKPPGQPPARSPQQD